MNALIERRSAVLALSSLAAFGGSASAKAPMQIRDGLYYNERFDPERNPRADIAAAGVLAREGGKRILMEVGGDWCVWCTIMDAYLIEHRDVRTAFLESFVIVKVNFSRENQNQAFLANFPQPEGYPVYYVLEHNGGLVAHQDTAVLEQGDSYNRARMLAFARRWRLDGRPE
jgi:thiol:disulfide interchange protein